MTKLNPNQWRSLDGEYAAYSVSSNGAVRRNSPELSLSAHTNSQGYRRVNVRRASDGRQILVLVHRLVAEAFLGPPESGMEVNHKNGVKDDNRIENLEWVTRLENSSHAFNTGLRRSMGFAHKRKLTDKQAEAIRILHSRGVTQGFLVRWFGIGRATLYHLLNGETYYKPACEVCR